MESVYEATPIISPPSPITALAAYDGRLFLTCEDGALRVYESSGRAGDDPGSRPEFTLAETVPKFVRERKVARAITVVPKWGVTFTVVGACGGSVRGDSLSLSQCSCARAGSPRTVFHPLPLSRWWRHHPRDGVVFKTGAHHPQRPGRPAAVPPPLL